MSSPIRTLISKSLIQLKIGGKFFSAFFFGLIYQIRFAPCKLFSSEYENLRLKWIFGLPEPSISGCKKDFYCQKRFHRTSKKAYNYFCFSELKDLLVPQRIAKSSRLANEKYWLKIQSANKIGAQK